MSNQTDKAAKDARLKILRTYEVPAAAIRREKNSEPLTLNVYADFGKLLVTRSMQLDGCEFNITHAPTGLKFGNFITLNAAKSCAREMKDFDCWNITEPDSFRVPRFAKREAKPYEIFGALAATIVDAGRAQVVPVLHRYKGK